MGLWIIDVIGKSAGAPLTVLYRSWEEHGRMLPSESTVRRFLCANGLDARSLKAGRLDQSDYGNDFWETSFDPNSKTYAVTYNLPLDGKSNTTWILKKIQQSK